MFRKFVAGFIAAMATLIYSSAPASTPAAYHAPRTYEVTAEIVSVENSTVQVTDAHGNVWELYADNVAVGDDVIITIDTNGTDDIHDDAVIDMR